VVPWAEAGVGAVATQSIVNVAFGPLGLDLLRGGLTPAQAMAALVAGDAEPHGRQVAIVDTEGRAAAHTGANAIPAAGHHVGAGYSCQANLMEKDTVWDAMAQAFEASESQPLADRLIEALRAAEREGGDIRGRQSAALVVVTGTPTGRPWDDRLIDLRVDDHPDPVEELARLVRVKRAWVTAAGGGRVLSTGREEDVKQLRLEALAIAPDQVQLRLMAGIAHAQAGEWDEALPLLRAVLAVEPRFREALRRMDSVGRIPPGLADLIESRL
jgi:uncharacterized Ntn-hydrolase superfamily protein